MFPWGAIIGLAGQAVSGVLSTINNKKAQREADAEAAREQAFYEAKANENPLSRSENQHLLGQYDRNAQQQIENARGVAAITGATPEFSTAVQKGVAEGRADLMGQMAAGASQRADRLNTEKRRASRGKYYEDMQRRAARNSTYAALAGNAASAVGSIMDGYSTPEASEFNVANVVGGIIEPEKTTSEKIATAPSRAAKLQKGAEAATSIVDKQVLTDTGDAAANAQKLATGSAVKPVDAGFASGQLYDPYVDNGDGTYSKGGVRYYKTPFGYSKVD